MALMSKPTHDPKLTRWWWRTLREWVYELIDPLWGAFRGENSDEIALVNVTGINDVSASELAILDGLTATNTELNKLSGLTAEASELNKADRTESDGVAEASKNVVLDINKDITGKRYDINQSLLDAIASKSFLWFDGSDDYVQVPDSDHLSFGDGASDFPFSFVTRLRVDDFTNVGLFGKYENPYEYYCLTDGDGKLDMDIRDTSVPVNVRIISDDPLTAYEGQVVDLAVTYDGRGGATAADGLTAYINGEAIPVTALNMSNYVAMENTTSPLRLGKGFSVYLGGDIYVFRVFNRRLGGDEVKALASGAPVGFADVGAGQGDLVTNGEDWTGASGSTPPNSWSDSGSGTAIYIIRDNTPVENFGDNKVLEFSASGGSKTLYQNVAQVDKRFRVSFVYRNLDGSSSSYVALGSSTNKATLQNTGISGDGILFEQDFMADGTDLMFFVGTDGTLQIDHVQVIQIGCVAQYQPAGITHAQWQDDSGNELHGSVNGAVPLNLPSNHVARYIKLGITGDTTLSAAVPAGYRIKSIVAEVSGAGAGMRLNIGTSAGGTDVVNNQDISSNGLFDLTVAKNIFSLSSAQSLYVNDDGGTAWSGVSVDLYIALERVK